MMQQTNMIQMEEHDHEQCAHIFFKKDQNHYQSHHGQKNLTKAHTAYPKDC
jgi:hypothetical protein